MFMQDIKNRSTNFLHFVSRIILEHSFLISPDIFGFFINIWSNEELTKRFLNTDDSRNTSVMCKNEQIFGKLYVSSLDFWPPLYNIK